MDTTKQNNAWMNSFIRGKAGSVAEPQPTQQPAPQPQAKANAGAGLDVLPRATTTNEAMNIYIRHMAGRI